MLGDRFFVKLKNAVGNAYLDLGPCLGIEITFIQQQEYEYPHDASRVTLEVLNKWRQSSTCAGDEDAMTKELLSALHDLDMNETIEMVKTGTTIGHCLPVVINKYNHLL